MPDDSLHPELQKTLFCATLCSLRNPPEPINGNYAMDLETINSPEELRRLSPDELPEAAAKIRELILATVSENGGHLASSLGAVELILALHYCFDTPRDRLLFDVGHQAYAHKILTGRREFFRTLRRPGGCAGFPASWESDYDVGAAGHAGTAISTALGISAANALAGSNAKAVAVVGDGSLNCGISFEGLNNARRDGGNLVVVLNDNKMSISENVGGLAYYLNRLVIGPRYNRLKTAAKRMLMTLPRHETLHRFIRRLEDVIKSLILPGVVFEELGFRYFGPINGHSLPDLLRTFRRVREFEGPILVHVVTEKGHGCDFAASAPERYHGVSGFDRATGALRGGKPMTFSRAFGDAMVELAGRYGDLAAITAGMTSATGLEPFHRAFPRRFYDAGIAEEHAVTFAAGLAAAGLRPVCAVYSTFLQRALDCIYHDVVLPQLPVIFAVDRAGAVEDGPTHHGIYDLGFLRAMPGLVILAPRCEAELLPMLEYARSLASPVAIRYPRGGTEDGMAGGFAPIETGRAEILRAGSDSGPVLWATGPECRTALDAADRLKREHGIDCAVVNARFLAPFDRETARKLAPGRLVVSLEDHVVVGGLGSALDEALAAFPCAGRLAFGWPAGKPVPHGAVSELRRAAKLTAADVAAQVAERCASRG